jgi:hypothetical protein
VTTRKRILIAATATASLALGGLGFAVAQDARATRNAADSEDAAADVERRANLSGPEQLAEAERIQARSAQIQERVAQMLDQARRDRDIMKITCLNDKLVQIRANGRSIAERRANLREADRARDSDRRNHEFTVLTVLSTKQNTLEQEANQCIGQDLFDTGATNVSTFVDPNTPDEDPTVVPEFPQYPIPYIPPPASPTT